MYEAFAFIACCNALAFGPRSLLVVTGLPFAAACLGILYVVGLLPSSMYAHGAPDAWHVCHLTLLVDAVQFWLHALEHRLHFRSHALHHAKTRPTCLDAFRTGFGDAAVQLIVPLCGALHCVRPNKTTAVMFGAFYASWLQWIHCDRDWALRVRSNVFVTPHSHRRHHLRPTSNLGHVFVAWDRLYGSADESE